MHFSKTSFAYIVVGFQFQGFLFSNSAAANNFGAINTADSPEQIEFGFAAQFDLSFCAFALHHLLRRCSSRQVLKADPLL
jgi:hypothetical protein